MQNTIHGIRKNKLIHTPQMLKQFYKIGNSVAAERSIVTEFSVYHRNISL